MPWLACVAPASTTPIKCRPSGSTSNVRTDPLDSLLDQSTAKALDRLQRYASANQRTYFKALKELRTIQTNRLLRRSLDDHDDPLPELVSPAEIAKRTHQIQAADDMAEWRAMKACIDAPIPGLQNEPNRPLAGIRKESAA